MNSSKSETRQSPISGLGKFSLTDIKKGELIKTLTGEIVSREEIDKRITAGIERPNDPLDVDDDTFFDLDNDSLYFNHSCHPNATLVGQSDLIAICDIKKDEEITFDYSLTVGTKDSDWEMPCCCGSSICRHKIGSFNTVPLDTLITYYQNNWLQDYIKQQVILFIHPTAPQNSPQGSSKPPISLKK